MSAAVAALCVLVFGLQLVSPLYETDGFFSAILVGLGEPWRIVTANFLHASPLHLVLNGLGLALLGAFVERSLGSRGTGPVLACAGLGAMAASYAAGYEHALGASGIVAGLAGALLWLELREPEAAACELAPSAAPVHRQHRPRGARPRRCPRHRPRGPRRRLRGRGARGRRSRPARSATPAAPARAWRC